MKTIVYPHHSILNEVETIFVNGIKFQILEFIKEAHKDFNIDKSRRFFLTIEDEYFAHSSLVDFHNVNKETAWRLYCNEKSFLMSIIDDISSEMDAIDRLKERASRVKEGKYNPFQIKIDDITASLRAKNVHYK